MKMTLKSICAGLLGLALLSATACNTVRGVGKDIETVGEKVQEIGD